MGEVVLVVVGWGCRGIEQVGTGLGFVEVFRGNQQSFTGLGLHLGHSSLSVVVPSNVRPRGSPFYIQVRGWIHSMLLQENCCARASSLTGKYSRTWSFVGDGGTKSPGWGGIVEHPKFNGTMFSADSLDEFNSRRRFLK